MAKTRQHTALTDIPFVYSHSSAYMFDKILVANRGEIACRVFKTARKMGIKTVAVYSDADHDALHTESADEAVRIGPAASIESYLKIDNIVAACKQTGADAVHPGYGFLSESKLFAEALTAAGITFIGPNPAAIEAMGDKIESKKIAANAGVNTIPGFAGVIKDSDHALDIAAGIGYPVMIKASAGGGGKGMRVAHNEIECTQGFERATSEARSSFGDDRVFIEKFIEQPRHIEIQIVADQAGNTVYLGERECSIQRRHQKIIEEAPSIFIDAKTRKAMGEQSVALAQAVDYQSVGTVEFIVDAVKNFYFLEMNTRLQVEHPVTEKITGLDLVELMIRIAAGENLEFVQSDVVVQGWAMETRVYAEDPLRSFLPSTGRLVRYQPPVQDDYVRVDTGVYEGGEVSMHYDPMIAKLITYDSTREQSITRMRRALDEYYIRGISHNIPFLSALMAHPRFRAGNLTTNFIQDEYPDGFQRVDVDADNKSIFVVSAGVVHLSYSERANKISGQVPKGKGVSHPTERVVVINQQYFDIAIDLIEHGYDVTFEGDVYRVISDWKLGQPLFKAEINGDEVCLQVERSGISYRIIHAGVEVNALVLSQAGAKLNRRMLEKAPADLSKFLLSPMPGLLKQLKVVAGDEVKGGEELAIVEAMKMENVLRASRDAVIKKTLVKEGNSLVVDQPLVEFE